MGQIFTIDDKRTMFIRGRMRAHNGSWNGVRMCWMFGDAGDAANALSELYRATRASIPMRETLLEMIADGTAGAAWGYDPLTPSIDVDEVEFAEAQRLLAAGYGARRVLGIHQLDDAPVEFTERDEADRNAAFDERARASFARTRRQGGAR